MLSGILAANAQTSNATIFGKVTDENGLPVDMVNVSLKNYPFGTTTNRKGEYLFRIPSGREVAVVFSMIGYNMEERKLSLASEATFELNVVMSSSNQEIDEIVIQEQRQTSGNIVRINPKSISSLPDVGMGSVEGVLRTLPGVSSSNELSNQYSVRGGNFDENLVYVNGIEVYRPTLIRAGQQEGLSFVNSDMVSSIQFSAGGFDASYGDKMSSVLDIKYSRPTQFKANVMASLMGARAHVESISDNKKFTYNMGARYKSFKLLLGSLAEKGVYDPSFIDFQGYFTYSPSPKFEIGFLGTASSNSYRFVPEKLEQTFGTFKNQLKLTIDFEGQEVDRFYTYTGALNFLYKPTPAINLNLALAAFSSDEQETYDIIGSYRFNEVQNEGTDQRDDSTILLGLGYYHEHGRNFLKANVLSVDHSGSFKSGGNVLSWGMNAKQEIISDRMNEWQYRDSAGYSLPYSDKEVKLYYAENTEYEHTKNRYSAYLQDSYSTPWGNGTLMITGGVRANYWDFTHKVFVSPRFSCSYKVDGTYDIIYRLAAGSYYQPAFYRELKNLYGEVADSIQTPHSLQVVAGVDYSFIAWERPFKLTAESYYKSLKNLIPYQYENVRIRYLSDQISDGFAYGLDVKVNGEFVSGTQSWVSASLMKTMEDIDGDVDSEGNQVGYIRRPNDQRFKFSMFFQDYLPGLPYYQMNLTGHFITGVPFGMPRSPRYLQKNQVPAYRRVDIGFLRLLVSNGDNLTSWRFLDRFKECSVGIEVYNLLDIRNVSSYSFIADFQNIYYAVENRLTGRMLNFTVSASF